MVKLPRCKDKHLKYVQGKNTSDFINEDFSDQTTCFRLPEADIQYLVLQRDSDHDTEIYFLDAFDINLLSQTCSLKRKLSETANICNLFQMINLPTRVHILTVQEGHQQPVLTSPNVNT